MPKTVIFSDLDGTLLDAVRYSFNDALPALSLIQAHGVPLVLCSSKTRAEIEACRQRMHNFHPFITENGGGIFILVGAERKHIGLDRTRLCPGDAIMLLNLEKLTTEAQS